MFRKQTVDQLEKSWEVEKPLLQTKEKIRCEKEEILNKKNSLSMTKRLMLFILINCTIIQIFTGYLMYEQLQLAATTGLSPDMGPQTALISSVVTEAIAFAVYCFKSLKENSKGGIVYDSTITNFEDDSKLSKG